MLLLKQKPQLTGFLELQAAAPATDAATTTMLLNHQQLFVAAVNVEAEGFRIVLESLEAVTGAAEF
jgi:hypothetical protein